MVFENGDTGFELVCIFFLTAVFFSKFFKAWRLIDIVFLK